MKLKRNLSILLIAATMLTCLPAVAFAATYTVSHIEEGDYYICASADNDYALSVVGSSTNQGTYFHLWEKITGNPDQVFTIEHVSGGWYTIKVKKTGLCLNVPGGNNENGQQLWTWPFDDTDSCLFRFASTGDGNYIIQNKLGRTLDLDNNLLFNGSRIHLWDPHEGASGRWKLERISTESTREDASDVKYTYKRVKLDCSSLEAWESSLASAGRYSLSGAIVGQNILSYKTIQVKVPGYGPHLPGNISNYDTVTLKLPCEIEYKLHTHTLNRGFGRNWYYTNNGIQLIETCNCGYRKEGLFWEIPDLTESSQTTRSVISGLPQF